MGINPVFRRSFAAKLNRTNKMLLLKARSANNSNCNETTRTNLSNETQTGRANHDGVGGCGGLEAVLTRNTLPNDGLAIKGNNSNVMDQQQQQQHKSKGPLVATSVKHDYAERRPLQEPHGNEYGSHQQVIVDSVSTTANTFAGAIDTCSGIYYSAPIYSSSGGGSINGHTRQQVVDMSASAAMADSHQLQHVSGAANYSPPIAAGGHYHGYYNAPGQAQHPDHTPPQLGEQQQQQQQQLLQLTELGPTSASLAPAAMQPLTSYESSSAAHDVGWC